MVFSASPILRISAIVLLSACAVRADWPTLRGNVERTGYVKSEILSEQEPSLHVAWIRHFENERLGTAMEPIVADGKVFIATHNGSINALDAATGEPLWRFEAGAPFLHSPAYAQGLVIAG